VSFASSAAGLAAAVAVTREERGEAFLSEAAGVQWAWVALQECQADRAVDVSEDLGSTGPEALQLGAQLVSQRDPGLHEVLAGTAQGAQRLGVVAVGDQNLEAVMVGARELAEHERVEAIGLPAAGPEARARRCDLVGMDRHHAQPGIEQPLDQQAVGTLDRDEHHTRPYERVAQRTQAALVMSECRRQHLFTTAVLDEHIMLLTGPIHPRIHLHDSLPSPVDHASQRPDREVPLRVLIDGPSTGLRPVAARGTSPRREEQVSQWPFTGLATQALTRREPRHTEDDQ